MRISDWSSDVCSSDLLCHQSGGDFQVAGLRLDVRFLHLRGGAIAGAALRRDLLQFGARGARLAGGELFGRCDQLLGQFAERDVRLVVPEKKAAERQQRGWDARESTGTRRKGAEGRNK